MKNKQKDCFSVINDKHKKRTVQQMAKLKLQNLTKND